MNHGQPHPETAESPPNTYVLRLYLAGMRPVSQRALLNIKRICETYLSGQYTLSVVDLYRDPALASSEQIIAAPTLVKSLPLPVKRIIGDMSDQTRVMRALELNGDDDANGDALPATRPPE
jgi:circadian clock protein KaiB